MSDTRQIAEQIAGRYFPIGSGKEAAILRGQLADTLAGALSDAEYRAEQRGRVQGLREAADMAERRWRGQTDMTFIRDAASAIEQETP